MHTCPQAFEKFGIVPNMELFLDLTFRHEELDFFSTGTIIGEKNVLTGEQRCATVTCETMVTAYHLSQEKMKQALTLFADPYDSLESRMWRSYGIRLATALLPTQPAYAVCLRLGFQCSVVLIMSCVYRHGR